MGYYSNFRGKLTITNNNQYPEELIIAAKNTGYDLPVINGLSPEAIATLKSNDHIRHFFDISETTIQPSGGEGTAQETIIQDLVAAIADAKATVNGEIIRIGEEQGDIERFVVTDNVIVVDRAKMVWENDNTPVPYYLYQQ